MTAFTIRSASSADAAVLFDIQKAASLVAFAHVFSAPFPDDEIRADWDERLADPAATVLVAERTGRPLGFATHRAELLDQLFVHPDAQNTGVGSALHEAVLEAQRRAGAAVCRLWVLEANTEARTFYDRRGWRPDGATRAVDNPPHPVALRYAIQL